MLYCPAPVNRLSKRYPRQSALAQLYCSPEGSNHMNRRINALELFLSEKENTLMDKCMKSPFIISENDVLAKHYSLIDAEIEKYEDCYHRQKIRPKSPDKKRPLIEQDTLRRLSAYFMKRLSYSCPVLRRTGQATVFTFQSSCFLAFGFVR